MSLFRNILCIFLICLCIDVSIAGRTFWKLRNKIEKYKRDWIKTRYHYQLLKSKLPLPMPEEVFPAQNFTQPLDHFDPEIERTYVQKYWINKDFWSSPDGPVFLYIGGEGAIDESTVMDGEHVDLAKKYGALLVSVEHRFYGLSINKDGLELGQLQYLSSQQALADLSTFHSFISEKYGLTEKNVWISFGGSYPGALSAWFRIKYPHLVYGAIASSAPVRAQVNFEGYNNVVAHSLGDPIVNGSYKCVSAIQDAFKTVDQMILKSQYQDLAMDFKTCTDLTDKDDRNQFVSGLADLFMGVVQYNNEMPGTNVESLCKTMTTESGDPYNRLRKLTLSSLDPEQNCTYSSWKKAIQELKDTTKSGGVGARQWIYQTCSQFGYYQTCDKNTDCIFSKYMDIDHQLKICYEVFGLKPNSVLTRANFTNAYYGADHPKGTRIVFVNGSIDPWHALSVLSDLSSSETSVFINGTAHCANMEPSRPDDPPQLVQARKKISEKIGLWLSEANKGVL